MSVLPAFSGAHPLCPKCQQPSERTRFCAADRRAGPVVPDCPLDRAGDHLHRICQCGYFWIERCADAAAPRESELEVERVETGLGSAPVARGGAEELRRRPVEARPDGAPGGIAGGASDEERSDPVTLASDESFPASDPPAY